MTDPVRDAAQALVDRIDRGRKEYQEAWPDDDAELDALRRALASPAPSTSTAGECDHRMCACPDGCECKRTECGAPSTSRDDARDDALEEAAEVISHILDTNAHGSGRAALAVARTRIRSLKVQPPPHSTPNPEES